MRIREKIQKLNRKGISRRIRSNELTQEDQRILLLFVRIMPALLESLRKSRRRVGNLLEMIWGKKTESSKNILKEIDKEEEEEAQPNQNIEVEQMNGQSTSERDGQAPGQSGNAVTSSGDGTEAPQSNVIPLNPKQKYRKDRKNNRNRGVLAFPDAEEIKCYHDDLKPGSKCPKCPNGMLYLLKTWGKFIQFIGSPLLKAKIFLQEKLRCNSCGAIFSAKIPPEAAAGRATPSASAIIALMKYGAGLPFYRYSTIQRYLKVPVSPSGIWKMLNPLIEVAVIIFKEMQRLAAQGEVIHNDDTVNKVLALIRSMKNQNWLEKSKKSRKKVFTTGILSKLGSTQIVLFFTGHKHAGENLEALLSDRDEALESPIQMADASTMNKPGRKETKAGGCLTHFRRGFVKSYRSAKEAVTYVIRKLKVVYRTESEAKKLGLNPEERLKLHQEKSGPIMEELKTWMDDQIVNKKVEENSSLGEAIGYGRNHWTKLTLFLRVAGVPLTNDELEQKFKMVKQHVKNSLFYKTLWGAFVGDMFMSIIHTSVLAGENPFDYLIAIQEHREEVMKAVGDWMPWNYRKTIAATLNIEKTA